MNNWEDDIKSIERRASIRKEPVSKKPEPRADDGVVTDKYGRPLSGRDDTVKAGPTGPNYGALASVSLTASYLALLGAVALYADALQNVLCGSVPGAGFALGGICLALWPIFLAAALVLSGAGIVSKRGQKTAIGVVAIIVLPLFYYLWLALGGPAIDFAFILDIAAPGLTPESKESVDLSSVLTLPGALSGPGAAPAFDFCADR